MNEAFEGFVALGHLTHLFHVLLADVPTSGDAVEFEGEAVAGLFGSLGADGADEDLAVLGDAVEEQSALLLEFVGGFGHGVVSLTGVVLHPLRIHHARAKSGP